MASISKHPARPNDPKKRPRWRARWRDPNGKQRSQVFDRKVDAEAHLTAMEHRKRTGEYVDPSAGRVTVRDWCEGWRKVQAHRQSTMQQVESHFRIHLYPTLGDHELRALRPSEVQAWVSKIGEGLKPATVSVIYAHFSSAMKAAAHDRLIARTPCERIKLPKREHREVVPPTVEEVAALAASIDERYRAAVVLAAGSGLRLGEVFGLQLDRVDFLRRLVRVDQQLVTPDNGPAFLAPPKTNAAVRAVPIADVVLEELAGHVRRFPPVEGFVFTNSAGQPVRRSALQKQWTLARRKACVDGVTFHGLRHHYASALIAAGCSVKAVQKALGHASATETLNTYAHLWPDDEDRTRAAIQALWVPESDHDPRCVTDVSSASVAVGGPVIFGTPGKAEWPANKGAT